MSSIARMSSSTRKTARPSLSRANMTPKEETMTFKTAPTPLLPHGRAAAASLRATPRIGLRHLISGSLLAAVTPFLSATPAVAQIKVGAPQEVSVGVNNTLPDNNSEEVVVPPNGDFVVFSSDATNLLPSGQDLNGARDLFLSSKGAVTLLSVAPDGSAMGANSSQEQGRAQNDPTNFPPDLFPAVSPVLPDGTYGVSFVSSNEKMWQGVYSDPTAQAFDQVYLRIPKLGKTVLISGNPTTKEVGNGPSFGSSITYITRSSGQNRFLVVFTSCATNLDNRISPGSRPGGKRLYLATVDISGSVPNVSSVSLLGGEDLIRLALDDLTTGASIPDVVPLVYDGGVDFDSPVISGDGSTVAFTVGSPNGVFYQDIRVLDPFPPQVLRFLEDKNNPPEVLSKTGTLGQQDGALGDGGSLYPSISYDGKRVAFSTAASNLGVSASTGQPKFVLWKDSDNSLTVINKTANGTPGDGSTPSGMISADGNYALWSDDATNLVSNDTNGGHDIFLKDLRDGSLQRVTKNEKGEQLDSYSFSPALGATSFTDPKLLRMAFASVATNIGTPGSSNISRIFVSSSVPLPPETIKNGAPISLPPDVTVNSKKRSVTFKFPKFRLPSRSKWTTNSTAEMEGLMAAAARGSITYEIFSNIKTKKRYDRIQSRNRVTLEQVTPGTYQVSYRVIGKLGNKKYVTKKSPVKKFTITK